MPTCVSCKQEFEKLASKSRCRSCYNAYMASYMLRRYYERRARAIEAMGGKCVQCGSAEDLEFDHVERAFKKGEIAKLLTQAEHRYLEELKQCQLLCRPCHIKKTRSEITVGHGGGLTGISKCKCEPCRLKRNERAREKKRERKQNQRNQGL